MNDQKNLILFSVLAVLVLVGWQYVFPPKHSPVSAISAPQVAGSAPSAMTSAGIPVVDAAVQRDQALGQPRVHIDTPELRGSIALVGGRLDDLALTQYHETTDPKSPNIVLLAPAVGDGAYYSEFGWVGASGSTAVLPGPTTEWTADGAQLTPDHPVTLSYDNGQGLKFSRTFAVDSAAMFTITEKVENSGSAAVSLAPYGLISRWGTPKTLDIYLLHEGPLGVLDGNLKEMKYKKLRDDQESVDTDSTGGWIGFTDKYWLTALIPDQSMAIKARMSWHNIDGLDRYQTDWLGTMVTIAPGAAVTTTSHLFTGAKQLSRLDSYSASLNIPLFDHAIDFGWFYFLTKPLFLLLRLIHSVVPNFGVAILIFTVLIKALFFPIANKSFRSMAKMRNLQPQIKALQAKYADDKTTLNQEMMALYKREGANPISGCLPLLIQIPVFFGLYKVLYVTIEMRQAPFFGWIHDLSVPDPTSFANLFGLIPWTPPQMLHIGVLPLIMGVTMFLQQKLSPTPIADPVQARMMSFMPVIFTFMMAKSPAGLMLYWAFSNIFTICQQWLILKTSKT